VLAAIGVAQMVGGVDLGSWAFPVFVTCLFVL